MLLGIIKTLTFEITTVYINKKKSVKVFVRSGEWGTWIYILKSVYFNQNRMPQFLFK